MGSLKRQCFPTCATEATEWSKLFGEPEELAVRRWIKFAALDCLARDEALRKAIIIRGSLAISFYDPTNRLGDDIDIYSILLPASASAEDVASITGSLNTAIHTWMPAHFSDLGRWATRIKKEIKIEIMRLEYDVRWNEFRLPSPSNRSLRVAKIECLIAEKLLALLHQNRRVQLGNVSKSRSKDVLDIHRIVHLSNQPIDLRQIIYHFDGQNEAVKEGVFVLHKSAFGASLMSLAAENYTGKTHEQSVVIPFEKAWASVISLVDAMSNIK